MRFVRINDENDEENVDVTKRDSTIKSHKTKKKVETEVIWHSVH